MQNEFVLICKMVGQQQWNVVTNPSFQEGNSEFYAAQMLKNFANEYVEYVNSGIVYRLVRQHTLSAYCKED